MADRTQPEQVGPEVRRRVRDSFDRQGLMAHLGARISRIASGRVHIELPGRPEAGQQHACFHAGATGDRIEAVGTVLKSGRTLTVRQLEVSGVQGCGERKLVASGQQTLIRMDRAEER
ncbi:PaaI family thioesterase [Streptomyces rimosus]|uniref:PaaI family thioesterase n=1 Tax=Streptomyces rimosus TaxID=1927 RepID=UPI0006B26492|nr:phenylacetic acid degradation protein PaaI [Streptomyces rimosus]